MRLFIGAELSEAVKDGAMTIAEELRTQFATVAPTAALRWIAPSHLHITLWFLGELDDRRAVALRESLAAPLTTPTFVLHAAGAGMFPRSGPPRALWVGLTDGAASLVAVYHELTARLVRLGFEAERRPYTPHLTIARFKDIDRKDIAAARKVTAQCAGDAGTCRIDAVTVFRSRLWPKGSQYEPLLRVPLI